MSAARVGDLPVPLSGADLVASMPRPSLVTRGAAPRFMIAVDGEEQASGREAGPMVRSFVERMADLGRGLGAVRLLLDARWYAGDGLSLSIPPSGTGPAFLIDARDGRELWRGRRAGAGAAWRRALSEWQSRLGPHKSSTVAAIWGKPGDDKTLALYGSPPW